MRSSLSPMWMHPARKPSDNVVSLKEPNSVPVAPAPAAARPRVEHLTAADVHNDLSTATINALIPINPELVAQLIIDAGRRRRAELPMNTSTLRPLARAIVLSGKRRRAEPLDDADAEFLAEFLENIGAR